MKTDNPSLAKIRCDGCEGEANIKRKRTGQKLLYLHCKTCGLDQRSGAKLQAKWQAAIDGIELVEASATESTEQAAPDVAMTDSIATEIVAGEWHPQTETTPETLSELQVTNNDDSSAATRADTGEQESSSNGFGWLKFFGTIAGTALVIARIRA